VPRGKTGEHSIVPILEAIQWKAWARISKEETARVCTFNVAERTSEIRFPPKMRGSRDQDILWRLRIHDGGIRKPRETDVSSARIET
jgi:hypothetical protein